MQTIPFHALFAEDNVNPNEKLDRHPAKIVKAAAVVVARDVMSGHEALVYGRKALKKVVAGKQNKDPQVLIVELDMDTDELERLLALVQVIKGRHEYQSQG